MRLARGVEAQHTAAVPQMRHHDYPWLTSIDGRCDSLGALENLADTLAHLVVAAHARAEDMLRRPDPHQTARPTLSP